MNPPNMRPSPTKVNTLDVALTYLAKHPDRYLFPLGGDKGRPLLKDNLNRASNNPVQLTRWAGSLPVRMWGCACKRSKIVCVDIDCGPGKKGRESFRALLASGPYTLPKTERDLTPSGGYHLIFKGEHHFSASKIGLHVDTPNYFVIPGCERADGNMYTVARGFDIGAAPLPDFLAEKIKPHADRPRREPSGEPIPLDLFNRMLAATPHQGGPAGLGDRREYNGWIAFAMACHEAAAGDESEYLSAFIEWCLKDPMVANKGWTAEQITQHWQSFTAEPPTNMSAITRASWLKLLSQLGRGEFAYELQLAADLGAFQADPWDGVIPPQAHARRNDRRRRARCQRMKGFQP